MSCPHCGYCSHCGRSNQSFYFQGVTWQGLQGQIAAGQAPTLFEQQEAQAQVGLGQAGNGQLAAALAQGCGHTQAGQK